MVYRLRLDETDDVDWVEPVGGGPDANGCGECPDDVSSAAGSEACRNYAYNPADAEDGDGLLGTDPITTSSTAVDRENVMSYPDDVVVMANGLRLIGRDDGP